MAEKKKTKTKKHEENELSCKEFTVSDTKLSLPWVFMAVEGKENKMKLMRVISKDLVFEM